MAGSLGGCAGSLGGVNTELAAVGGQHSGAELELMDENKTTDGVVSLTASQKKKSAPKTATTEKVDSSAYLIGAHDVLDITVFRVQELSKTIQVASEGTINFPLIGQVQAKGKTAKEVEQTLTAKLGTKYLRNPQVTVYVKEFNSRRVTINGAVKKPGVFPIRGKMTLMSLIATAEGLNKEADSTIAVFRVKANKREATRFDIDAIQSGDAEDPLLKSDDVVVVGTSAIKAAFQNFLKVVPVVGTFAAL